MTLKTKTNVGLTSFEDLKLSPRLSEIAPKMLNAFLGTPTDKPVLGKKVAEHFNISRVEVRAIVAYLREQGNLITSTGKGYALATDPDDPELDKTINHFFERETQNRRRRESLQAAREKARELKLRQ